MRAGVGDEVMMTQNMIYIILGVTAVVVLSIVTGMIIRKAGKKKALQKAVQEAERLEQIKSAEEKLMGLLPFIQDKKDTLSRIRKRPLSRVKEPLYGEEEEELFRGVETYGPSVMEDSDIQALLGFGRSLKALEEARLAVNTCTDEQLMQIGSPLTVFNDQVKSLTRSLDPGFGEDSLAAVIDRLPGQSSTQ